MKLRFDPFQVFRHSKTPTGLYARKKWLQERLHSGCKKDFEETVRFLLAGQSPDGSWENSFIKTVQRLFGLHLTVREGIEPVQRGLEWLKGRTSAFFSQERPPPPEKISASELAGLPFTKSAFAPLLTGATLFLFCVFEREDDPEIREIYDRLEARGCEASGRWCGWPSYCNILRAFVVHSTFSGSRAVALAVKNLQRVQKPSGLWPRGIPFYQMVNALAHLDSDEGDAQLAPAFERLYASQRSDGTWSRSEPEWNTFLVIHALRNKG